MRDVYSTSKTYNAIKSIKNPVFVCVISYTATSEIPGLTVAGANPELVKYTPAADSEFLYHGHCKCINFVPATPDGKPTPALITRTALQVAEIPLLIVDAGALIKPLIPYVSFGLKPGMNIMKEDAMDLSSVDKALNYGTLFGRQLAKLSDFVIIGESIPGGTTTALAVLSALGIDAKFKVSSSMPENPHGLKNEVVASAMKRAMATFGSTSSPLEAIATFGDPMMPSVCGIATGALEEESRVMLAGGTQMSTIVAILKHLGSPLKKLCIGTTTYVTHDSSSDIQGFVSMISRQTPILSCNLHLDKSNKRGLRAIAEGFVKEGVGAGGASIVAMLKSRGKITGIKLMKAIEKEYETSIQATVNKPQS